MNKFRTCPIDELTRLIIGEMFETYYMYGPGLFERIYEATLAGRLRERGLCVERQVRIKIENAYVQDEPAFVADLIVEGRVVIELKSVEKLPNLAYLQLRSYLNLLDISTGLLVNFNTDYLKSSIKRVGQGKYRKAA